MIDVTIPYSSLLAELGREPGSYQQHVIDNGHIPGVLSGAELRGRARKYGARYLASRETVRTALFRLAAVRQMRMLIDSRWCIVWAAGTRPRMCRVRIDYTS